MTKERITEHPMDQKYKQMYKKEREKLTKEFESSQKAQPILIEESHPTKLFSQNTTIAKRSDSATFTSQSHFQHVLQQSSKQH